MRIRWGNVVGFALSALGIVLLVNNWSVIVEFLGAMEGMLPGQGHDRFTRGMISFGMVTVAIIGAIRLWQRGRE